MAIIGRHSIGQMLIQAGKIDNNQLQSALNMQQEQDTYIGLIFKKLGYIDENELFRYISLQMKIPFINCELSASVVFFSLGSVYIARSKRLLMPS